MSVSIKLEGVGSVQAVFRELADEIGDKKANSKILIPAVREAMKPVLAKARTDAPVDTAPGKKLAKLGIKSDARAIAQEFGTARNPAHPYLRAALESQSTSVVNNLAGILARRIDKYKKANL